MRVNEYRQAGMVITEHVVESPLDHRDPARGSIEVFAREVVSSANAGRDLPRLLWLQGGPGNRAQRPTAPSTWLGRALRDYRVVLLDQRGTGLSTPANRRTLAEVGGPEAQADYLSLFRADSIVGDAEVLRRHLGGDESWSVLGQSFGGFVTLSYLSFAPEGLREAFVTGGLPPLAGTADDVYRLTYDRTVEQNELYFARHPADRELVRRVVDVLSAGETRLPTGEVLTPRRFQTAGIQLGTRSGFDSLHFLLEQAFAGSPGRDRLGDTFLAELGAALSFAANPLYAVLHEPIYNQGTASSWAAEREYQRRPEFAVDAEDFLFTGEMIYPLHFAEVPALTPLRETAELLASRTDWPALYDPARLAANEVPAFAAVYYDDMFVAREHSLATASAVRGLRPWITNDYAHDGVRADAAVLDRLLAMAGGLS
ncbi:alpha/beta fold hydrolase [Actinoalloteichus caeruleus]|uniref:alpha/beta fold hydrolase n=1 Tax=Actinoalloteichus cyanogriseus TaxID=2893586 RepID=UPI003BB8E850